MVYWATVNRTRIIVELSGTPTDGAKGEVFDIKTPSLVGYCAKIYHKDHICPDLIEKLEYMVSHQIAISSSEIRVCWPEILLYDDLNHVIGFIMRKAFDGSRDLEILQDNGNMEPLEKEYPKWTDWHPYDFAEENSYILRLKLLFNTANAIRAIHENKRVVIHDFKPSNVLATPDGKISIVDVDSFQIQTESGRLFESSAYTPDYFPKQAYSQMANHLPADQSCDTFAFAVVAFNTLIGVHPFSGFIRLQPFDSEEYSTLEACIKNDLSPYSKNKKYVKRLDPEFDCHQRVAGIDSRIFSLFVRSFDSSKKTPTIKEWLNVLLPIVYPEKVEIEKQLVNGEHGDEDRVFPNPIPEPFITISLWPAILLSIQVLIVLAFIISQFWGVFKSGRNNSLSFWIAEATFVSLFALSAVMVIRGFIIVHSSDTMQNAYVPLYNDAYLSDTSQTFLTEIQQDCCPCEQIDVCNVIVYDYLRELQTNKLIKMDHYLPSFEQFKVFPLESLRLMLSSEKMLSDLNCESEYYSLQSVVEQCRSHIEKRMIIGR